MRKMTKTVATLAAMSAMTVASASLAFAAEKQMEGLTGGTWSPQTNGSWKYKTEAGVQLKDTWAEIDGVWYYFKGETMAQDRFLVLDDKGYFFDGNGRLATGWQKISSKMDAYGDLSISEDLYYPTNNGYETVNDTYEYDYHDFVWCYFDESGVAKENEWFKDPASGRWYYFDENIMVKNVFNYKVEPDNYDVTKSSAIKYYGFDENGAMMTGWNSKKTKTTWNDPTQDDKGDVWYYYKPSGQMQQAGWAQIGDDWYLFADNNADMQTSATKYDGDNEGEWLYGGFPLIVNSYVASYKNNSSVEYFFVDGSGKLQNGEQNVKKAWKVLFYNQGYNNDDDTIDVAYEQTKVADKDIWVNFSDKGFAAKKGVKNNYYYAMDNANVFKTTFGTDAGNVTTINNRLYDATAYFDNYRTLNASGWNFTDTGVASQTSVGTDYDADNEIVDYITAGSYVNTTDFSVITEAAYDALPKKTSNVATVNGPAYANDKTDYIVMADTANAETARSIAAQAYADKIAADNALTVAKNNWTPVLTTQLDATAVVPTGYTDVITGSVLTDLLNSGNQTYAGVKTVLATQKTLKDELHTSWKLMKAEGLSDEDVKPAYDAYVDQTKVVAELEKVAVKAKTDATVTVLSNTTNAALSDAYERAKTAYNNAVNAYSVAKSAALAYKYSEFRNQWDVAIDSTVTNFAVKGERVKNAFIAQDTDKLYMADADGKLIANKAVLIDKTAGIVHTDGETYNNAYILFGSDGLATTGYTDGTKKTITIGGIAYWTTGKTTQIGKAEVTIFVRDKRYDTTY